MSAPKNHNFIQGIVETFLKGNLAMMLVVLSILIGGVMLMVTPREEEPQIVVPMADVFVSVPGATASEVERQVSTRLEKMLSQIDGVEYVYSMSRSESTIVTVRFYVGEDREDSLLKLYNKLNSNTDEVPASVAGWVVKPVEIDDVPIVDVALYSAEYSDAELRRVAEEVEISLQSIPNANKVSVTGGRPRALRVELDNALLAAHELTPLEIRQSLAITNSQTRSGTFETANNEYVVDAGAFVSTVTELKNLVVGVHGGRPVRLSDVADVIDGPEEVLSYTKIGFGPAAENIPADVREAVKTETLPAVHVAVAKKKGSNAVWVARAVEKRMEQLQREIFPDGVHYRIVRDNGETANEKVDELVEGLAIALIIVIGLFMLTMGWREALIVAVAVPITFSLTLFVNYLAGYTINRVTLFALTLALGLVVDDPIVDVENIHRHFKMMKEKPFRAVLTAVNEVRPPIILATMAVILTFIPLFFITGMMGPYMRPMALNVPVSMVMSLLVAFTVTPWMSYHVLRGEYGKKDEKPWVLEESGIYKFYNRALPPFLHSRAKAWGLTGVTVGLFGFALWLGAARLVPLKMLPFDNKNEFQIVIETPEGTTLESTEAATAALADYLRTVPEVTAFTTFSGLASPMDFNGMVRHYFLREGSNVADIRVNLANKKDRAQGSHALVLRLRNDLAAIAAKHGAIVKLVESPPGPPVLSTVVAEIYGPPEASYDDLTGAARVVKERLVREEGVVDVDDSIEAEQERYRFIVDTEKAALTGVDASTIASTVQLALSGASAGILRNEHEVNPLAIKLRLPRGVRSSVSQLGSIRVKGNTGTLVALSELGYFEKTPIDKTIYHKNLERVVYLYAEMAGRAPAEAIVDIQTDRVRDAAGPAGLLDASAGGRSASMRSYYNNGAGLKWRLPGRYTVQWAGEGEWDITLRVFRDLGLAFAAACMGIYILLVYQTGSYFMPLILMISIPLTMIGIMPGFWLLNLFTTPAGGWPDPVFFTATAMIGMIALAGIVVRNAILLIEFVHEALRKGQPLEEALIHSGAVRLRPIILTAGSAMLAAWPITLDPIFSGLAWALIFGLLVSTLFTLALVPVIYWMVYRNKPGHGLAPEDEEETA